MTGGKGLSLKGVEQRSAMIMLSRPMKQIQSFTIFLSHHNYGEACNNQLLLRSFLEKMTYFCLKRPILIRDSSLRAAVGR